MTKIVKRWQIHPKILPTVDQALKLYDPILRQLLFNRGYATEESAELFLQAKQPTISSETQLTGLNESLKRICAAIEKKEKIIIYGDYDVDGVTATALLVEILQHIGADVQGYIPNRFEEGYGLNNDALLHIKSIGGKLVITVDCGIRSLPEAEYAKSIGLSMIITDHHHPHEELPIAEAIINPKQLADLYPDKDLAGVGLAYKLGCEIIKKTTNYSNLTSSFGLDLVALGTIADLAPLVGENRSLVRKGIQVINQTNRPGLQALINISGLKPGQINSTDVGYVIGPRLNAAGRLESALDSLNLLLTSDMTEAQSLAQKIDNQNRERQQLTRNQQKLAEELIQTQTTSASLLFAAHHDFNPGVIGLVASRLADYHYRPVIIVHQGEFFSRGSCRSIPEYHITDALDSCADLMEHHGGHAAAAGFTIRNERLPDLMDHLQTHAVNQLNGLELRPVLIADMELSLSELHPSILNSINLLQPSGYANPPVCFVTRDLSIKRARSVGRDNSHLRLSLSNEWITYDAIAFGLGDLVDKLPDRIDILYQYEKNIFNGRESLQLNIKDIKASGLVDKY